MTNADQSLVLISDADTVQLLYDELSMRLDRRSLTTGPFTDAPVNTSGIGAVSQIVVALGSAGGAGVIGKLLIEVVRARRSTIEVQAGGTTVKVSGNMVNLEQTITDILSQLNQPQESD